MSYVRSFRVRTSFYAAAVWGVWSPLKVYFPETVWSVLNICFIEPIEAMAYWSFVALVSPRIDASVL